MLSFTVGLVFSPSSTITVIPTHRAIKYFPLLSLGYTFHTPLGSGMLSELVFPHIRCCLSAIPSDLMKSTAVDESLSSMNQQFCSRENQPLQMLQQNEKSTQIHIRKLWDRIAETT